MNEEQIIDAMSSAPAAAEWAVVELMGHVRLAGRLTEEERFGSKLGRLDVPAGEGYTTIFFGGNSVYRITLVAEEVARNVARQTSPAPVSPWEYPKTPALAHQAEPGTPDEDDLGDDQDDDLPY